MDDMNEDRLADFVDEHLRHLRGEGPAPDLTALDEAERAEVGPLLELIDAMTDTLPASPPPADDPDAIRLGIAGTPAGAEDEAGDDERTSVGAGKVGSVSRDRGGGRI